MSSATRSWAMALLSLLTASCAEQGLRNKHATTTAHSPPLLVASLAPSTVKAHDALPLAREAINSTVWDRLRGSFEMADCSSNRETTRWARRYTARPRQFEDQMRLALPRLVYVEQIAAKHHVAGEFALLPWVESQYRPVKARRHRPSGMWQIMPKTAGTLGLHVDTNYDARMDVSASTDAVMSLLRRYQDYFDDWRLTDYAYNAGQFAVRKLVDRHGAPGSMPVIPTLPVRRVTREHLVKLMAIACVVRNPARFHVSLPSLPAAAHLVAVPLDRAMPMKVAARQAGLPLEALRRYNTGPRNGKLDPRHAPTVLLPKSRVNAFVDASRRASTTDTMTGESALSEAARNEKNPASIVTGPPRTHKVLPGETLWTIARHYSIKLKQLLHWNDLHGNQLQIGQMLILQSPH